MIGIAVICHGDMAMGMESSVKLIAGKQQQLSVLGLYEGDDFEAFKEKVYEAIRGCDTGEGVLAFVDMYGASPFNATSMNITRLRQEGVKLRVITGVNLPMLIEACVGREGAVDVDSLYPGIVEVGMDSIKELLDSMGM